MKNQNYKYGDILIMRRKDGMFAGVSNSLKIADDGGIHVETTKIEGPTALYVLDQFSKLGF